MSSAQIAKARLGAALGADRAIQLARAQMAPVIARAHEVTRPSRNRKLARDWGSGNAIAGMDERFDLVGPAELEEVVQIENQIEAKRLERDREAKQAMEERRRAAEAEAEAQARADAARITSGGKAEQVLVIDWKAPSKEVLAGVTAREVQEAQRLANLVAPLVLQKVQQSRAVSVRGRA